MSRSGLKFLAIILALSMVLVLFAGLDNLPRAVRAQIDSERTALASAQQQARAAQEDVNLQTQADPALFRTLPSAQQWPDRFSKSAAQLQSAVRDMDELSRLEKQNRRQDRPRVETLLSEERNWRTSAVTDASGVRKEAAHWVDLKQHLPQALDQMGRDYQAVHDFDLAPTVAAVQKAETDWPDKKADLEGRLSAERDLVTESDRLWETTAAARRQAAAGDMANLDYGVLLGAVDRLHSDAAELPAKSGELKLLTAQLYTSWDKLLVDMETRGVGTSKEYDQKIRTVKTVVPDAAAKTGDTTSEERWQPVPKATYEVMQNQLGMAIEHKPAGKYDAEANHVPQPAGFAYMAPPGQSNQYGHWENRDGRDFWVFYGQYALMRDLLFNHNYQPPDRGEWDGYRSSQSRGQTYYGNDSGGQKYGTQGTATQQRYSGSSYAQGGGFKDSRFASKSGSYRSSPYATPSARQPGGSSEPRTFGRNSSPEGPRAAPRSYRPAPRSFSMPRSTGRSFGRHR